MTTPSRPAPYSQELKKEEAKLARVLLGGHAPSIAKAALAMDNVKDAIITQLLVILNEECRQLCRLGPDTSLFRTVSLSQMMDFKWDGMLTQLKTTAPLLLKILHSLASRNDHRNKVKIGAVHSPGICTAAAVILKERNREMCGLQSITSLLMYSCHCEKQVIKIINTTFLVHYSIGQHSWYLLN